MPGRKDIGLKERIGLSRYKPANGKEKRERLVRLESVLEQLHREQSSALAREEESLRIRKEEMLQREQEVHQREQNFKVLQRQQDAANLQAARLTACQWILAIIVLLLTAFWIYWATHGIVVSSSPHVGFGTVQSTVTASASSPATQMASGLPAQKDVDTESNKLVPEKLSLHPVEDYSKYAPRFVGNRNSENKPGPIVPPGPSHSTSESHVSAEPPPIRHCRVSLQQLEYPESSDLQYNDMTTSESFHFSNRHGAYRKDASEIIGDATCLQVSTTGLSPTRITSITLQPGDWSIKLSFQAWTTNPYGLCYGEDADVAFAIVDASAQYDQDDPLHGVIASRSMKVPTSSALVRLNVPDLHVAAVPLTLQVRFHFTSLRPCGQQTLILSGAPHKGFEFVLERRARKN